MPYQAEIEYDNEHNCYLLPLSEKLLQELDWKIGDTLLWCIKNNQIYLRKFENKSKVDNNELLLSIIEEANNGKG